MNLSLGLRPVCAPVSATNAPFDAIEPSPLREAIASRLSMVLFLTLFAGFSTKVRKGSWFDLKLVAMWILFF